MPDKQRHTADDDASGHLQNAVGWRGQVQLHVVHELHRPVVPRPGTVRDVTQLDDGEHQRPPILQHQRNCRYWTDLVEAEPARSPIESLKTAMPMLNPADDDR